MRKIIFHDDGLFQTGVCNGKIFGIYEDVLSVAGRLYYFLYAGQPDGWGRTVSFGAGAIRQPCTNYVGNGNDAVAFRFSVICVSSGLPGGSFIPTLVTGGLLGQIVGLLGVEYGVIEPENVSYVMLISMSAFLVAVIRTPLTAIVLITEITGHFEVFYPSVVVGGLTYYFTELLQIRPFNVTLYEDMINTPAFQEQTRYKLSIEVMTGSYMDGKLVDELSLPENCTIINVHRDGKDAKPPGIRLIPGDQVDIELDAQDIEKLYEPLVSLANIY